MTRPQRRADRDFAAAFAVMTSDVTTETKETMSTTMTTVDTIPIPAMTIIGNLTADPELRYGKEGPARVEIATLMDDMGWRGARPIIYAALRRRIPRAVSGS